MKLQCDWCKHQYDPNKVVRIEPYRNRHFDKLECRYAFIRNDEQRHAKQLELNLEPERRAT